MAKATYTFPFGVGTGGRIAATGGDEAIRAKVIQVLFTAPGERVNKPDFGCGLLNLVFEPNNTILAAAMEFTIAKGLSRWLKDDVLVNAVTVEAQDENMNVQVVYTRKQDLAQQAVRIQFK